MEAREILNLDTSKTVLEKFIQKLQYLDGEIDREKFKQLMKEIQNETSIKGGVNGSFEIFPKW